MRTLQKIKPTSEQLFILTDDGPGFRLIRGAAGSGKTTTALMRLRQLCTSRLSRKNRLKSDEQVRVLVLTFNRTLKGYVTQLANEQILAPDGLNISVETFASWALGQVGQRRIIQHDEKHNWMSSQLSNVGVATSNLEYFIDEIEYIIGRFWPDKRADYLHAVRTGRGRSPAVPEKMRIKLLTEVIRPHEKHKLKKGIVDWNDIALEAATVSSKGYDILIVDECQDFSANQVRAILKHLKADHGTTFIIDTVQRIYPQSFQWRELGIEMRGQKVFSLSQNHRNTKQIAQFAASMINNLPTEEDGVVPDKNACQRTGALPEIVAGTFSAQLTYMLNHAQQHLDAGEIIAILHPRGGGWFDYVRKVLQEHNISYCEITRKSEWPSGPELVALSTIHSAKGLEFDHVFLPGLNKEITPHGDEDGDGTLDSLRRLLAMGIGRARHTVKIGYKPGEQSTLIDMINPDTYDLVKV